MTAEVAIMNQHALVLAADSATTVTMWVQGERQTRYFKGANKLFQLSAKQPVGLMIYSSASLHDVPWELLVKDFRTHLGTDSCDRLAGYSRRFFEFVKAHGTLFPDDVRAQLFADQARTAAFRMGYKIAEGCGKRRGRSGAVSRRAGSLGGSARGAASGDPRGADRGCGS